MMSRDLRPGEVAAAHLAGLALGAALIVGLAVPVALLLRLLC
jgi:hypothetical protein